MSKSDLKKQAEDLEKQLDHQLVVLKEESVSWAKVGGAVVAGSMLVYGTKKLFKGGKKKKHKAKKQKGEQSASSSDHVKQPKAKKSSLAGSLGKRLFMVALSLGQAKLVDVLSKQANDAKKK
ncbi:hypothetical protein DN752_12770 [Echinicola strongylocentroti]|uniref:Uncharacterized protein n=1 Tax=Echinicola strongylocentroti TaxID=1795355 RepID=A0A2Z4IJQ3_9BACT|nr:hypothetical protein [Echinicola strongylocentroti]AWW30930.1 hypothetical protein DN752_12770 [Echinicola strongylocentroti]